MSHISAKGKSVFGRTEIIRFGHITDIKLLIFLSIHSNKRFYVRGMAMLFTFECPKCQNNFQVRAAELAKNPEAVKCCLCGDTPAPDIMTAYANIGKTMIELSEQCDCAGRKEWLPKEIRR